jgi:voltage-gated potassium channel
MTRPHATDFLESMLRDKEQALRVEEVIVPPESPYVGRAVETLELPSMGNILLLAVRNGQGEWIYNPPASLLLEQHMHLIVLATPEERRRLQYALQSES